MQPSVLVSAALFSSVVAHAEKTIVIIGRDGRVVVTALAGPRVGVEGQRVDDGGWCAFGTIANEAGITDTDTAINIGRCAPADPIVAGPHWCPLSAGSSSRPANGEPQSASDIVRRDSRVVVTALAIPQHVCGGIVDVFSNRRPCSQCQAPGRPRSRRRRHNNSHRPPCRDPPRPRRSRD